jgi:predicted PurR-regulated permease PerM
VRLLKSADDKSRASAALEIAIHIGLAVLLIVTCLIILRPFIPALAWGVITAASVRPGFHRLERALGGRRVLAAVLFTVLLLALLIVPIVLLAETLIQGLETLIAHVQNGTLAVPPPPAGVEDWPIIGHRLNSLWTLASRNLTGAIEKHLPELETFVPSLLAASAGVGLSIVQFAISIVIAGVLLANARTADAVTAALSNRLFDDRGPEMRQLMGDTIRSVAIGVLGVALFQTVLAGIGFVVAGVPGAGIWATVFMVFTVLQVGVLVLLPAAIYIFAVSSVTKGVIFLGWCLFVGNVDYLLKPLVLGRRVPVPSLVVFLGALGGVFTFGLIGLFVGSIVLAVGYKLLLAWIGGTPAPNRDRAIGS